MPISPRRARRPDTLAVSVTAVLDDMQCPVSTTAIRIILTDRSVPVTAERLGRLAGYQREDFQRTRIPPQLVWALLTTGDATNPRWWARGDWRLERRIFTDDVKSQWLARLAERLCLDLAGRPHGRDPALITHTLGTIAQATGRQYFEVPASAEEWMALRREVYERHLGVFHNLTGPTAQQHAAEAALQARGLSGFELLFGADSAR